MTKVPNDTDLLVGRRARIRRVELGLSQTALASQLGITFQQVQKYEKGVNRIGASRLQAMANVLAVPVSYFFPDAGARGDQAVKPLEFLDLLTTPGAVDLLRDFTVIDRAARKSLCVMARTLARAANGPALDPAEREH
jgi:transcriptional regulator with XRE-family HTH domain